MSVVNFRQSFADLSDGALIGQGGWLAQTTVTTTTALTVASGVVSIATTGTGAARLDTLISPIPDEQGVFTLGFVVSVSRTSNSSGFVELEWGSLENGNDDHFCKLRYSLTSGNLDGIAMIVSNDSGSPSIADAYADGEHRVEVHGDHGLLRVFIDGTERMSRPTNSPDSPDATGITLTVNKTNTQGTAPTINVKEVYFRNPPGTQSTGARRGILAWEVP